MNNLHSHSPSGANRIAQVTWAIHTLSCLTKQSHHVESQQDISIISLPDEEDEEAIEIYGDTKVTPVINTIPDSIRHKFLNCIAQILSPAKGGAHVTATALRESDSAVEVYVARNDCFNMNGIAFEFPEREQRYCEELEYYLSFAGRRPGYDISTAHLSSAEIMAIDYTKDRVYQQANRLRELLSTITPSFIHQDPYWSAQAELLNLEGEYSAWIKLTTLLLNKTDQTTTTTRNSVVYSAYQCIVGSNFEQLLQICLNDDTVSKIRRALRTLARPLFDCRLMLEIATRVPMFKNTRIKPVPPALKTRLSQEHQVHISTAWSHLTATPVTEEIAAIINPLNEQFQSGCKKSHNLHAEMQLLQFFEDFPASNPTLRFFGCSKRTCLPCEVVLNSLPDPIATRGRHGVCHAGWGTPSSTSSNIQIALEGLQRDLVFRIKNWLTHPMEEKTNMSINDVHLSTLTSSLSMWTRGEAERVQYTHKISVEKYHKEEEIRSIRIGEFSKPSTPTPHELYPEYFCVMCNKAPATPCTQCHSCYYCSQQCLHTDSPAHQLICKNFATQPPRPSESHKRAFLFPTDGNAPQVVWLPVRNVASYDYASSDDDDEGCESSYEDVNIYPHLGNDRPNPDRMYIEYSPVRHRKLSHSLDSFSPYEEGCLLTLLFRENFATDNSSVNQSVRALLIAGGGAVPGILVSTFSLRGPVIAIRSSGPEGPYEDITTADLRHVVDYLVRYSIETVSEMASPEEPLQGTYRLGVKIRCDGDINLHGGSRFCPVKVPLEHSMYEPILQLSETVPVSQLLGCPLRVWRETDVEQWLSAPGGDTNQDATCLMLEMDMARDSWGWEPAAWDVGTVGNVIVMREDGAALDVALVQQMCCFMRCKMKPLIDGALGYGIVQRTKDEVMAFVTMRNFEECKAHVGGWNDE